MKIDFAVIGGQKCGSTFIQSIIEEHPETSVVRGEVPYFEDPDYNNQGLSKLESKLNQLDKQKLIGIKRPNILTLPEVPQRLSTHSPEIKLICILRNPIERIVSAYYHYLNFGHIPIQNINMGLESLLNGSLSISHPRSKELIDFGFYNKGITNYFEFFNKENIKVFIYDDLRKDKMRVIQESYHFLGLDSDYIPNSRSGTPMKVNYSLTRSYFIRFKYRILFKYNHDSTRVYRKKLTLFGRILYGLCDRFDNLILSKLFNSSTKPVLSKKVKTQLLKIYMDDINSLESTLNISLSHWKS